MKPMHYFGFECTLKTAKIFILCIFWLMIKRKHLTNHNLHLQCAIVHASRFNKNITWNGRKREIEIENCWFYLKCISSFSIQFEKIYKESFMKSCLHRRNVNIYLNRIIIKCCFPARRWQVCRPRWRGWPQLTRWWRRTSASPGPATTRSRPRTESWRESWRSSGNWRKDRNQATVELQKLQVNLKKKRKEPPLSR